MKFDADSFVEAIKSRAKTVSRTLGVGGIGLHAGFTSITKEHVGSVLTMKTEDHPLLRSVWGINKTGSSLQAQIRKLRSALVAGGVIRD